MAFPELGGEPGTLWVKAKVDTGARTSAIHARNVTIFAGQDRDWVRFTVLPWQSSTRDPVEVEARLEGQRWVRSSSGQREYRPVVKLPLQIAGITHVVEFTLSHRPQMGFRILLGRQALRGHYQVDPGQSYLGGRPPLNVQVANRSRHGYSSNGSSSKSSKSTKSTKSSSSSNGRTPAPARTGTARASR